MDVLINLEFLALNGNQITTVENLKNLKNLTLLNLSENIIEMIKSSEFPPSLQYLIIQENPFYDSQVLKSYNLHYINEQIKGELEKRDSFKSPKYHRNR